MANRPFPNPNADALPHGDRQPSGGLVPPSAARQRALHSDRNLLQHATARARALALNEIANHYSCWRLRNEDDARFAWRLAIHIQEKIIHDEEQLENVLSLSRTEDRNLTGDAHE